MSQLAARMARTIERRRLFGPGASLVAGVSGGADSLCLLHVLRELAPPMGLRLHIAHLNHGLRGAEAAADAEFVRAQAAAWNIPATVEARDVKAYAAEHHLALEEAARQVRYAFLAATATGIGATHIAVAHHADDQAETVLMHFLRGSGPAGLRGMLPSMPLTDYTALTAHAATSARTLLLVRPLLDETRASIDEYCAEHGLVPRVDSTNADTRVYRNRLRHELLPILRTYNPGIDQVLAHTAQVMAGDYEVLHDAAEAAFVAVFVEDEATPASLTFRLRPWRALPLGLQRATVREAVMRLRQTLRNINWEHVEHAVRVGREGKTGDAATIAAGLALTVDYDRLRIGPEGELVATDGPQVAASIQLQAPGVTELGAGWRVHAQMLPRSQLPPSYAENGDPWMAYLDAGLTGGALCVRPRQPGDRFQPLGLGGHSARVNEYMINAKVPAAARAGWPVLEGDRGIAWVCGLRVDERAAVSERTEWIWQVRFEKWAE